MTTQAPTTPSASRTFVLLAVFVFSAAVLGAQIAWTRIFSFMIWYHFAFLVVSIAMLGFTSGGILLGARPGLLERPRRDVLSLSATAFAATSAAGLLLVINLPFDGSVLESAWDFSLFVALILTVGAEFFFAGLFVAFVIATEPDRVAPIYFANMAGSGAGCALAVVFLDSLLPTTSLLAFAMLAGAASLALAIRGSRTAIAAGLAVVALTGAAYASSLEPLDEPFYLESTKSFPALDKSQIMGRRSNSYAVLDIFEPGRLSGLWGVSLKEFAAAHPGVMPPSRVGLCIDGWALTFAYSAQGEITKHPMWDYLPATFAYQLRRQPNVLVIGAGGGTDVIAALRYGAEHVTAVDINPAIIDEDLGELAQFNQNLFHRPRVRPVVSEGRSFLASSGDERWDLVQLSGVDTLAAGQAGAFALSENYPYTREAVDLYLDHLEDDGMLTLTRWVYDPPRQTLRVITIVAAALEERGITNPAEHVMIIKASSARFSVFVVSKAPFTLADSQRALEIARQRGFVPLALPHVDLDPDGTNLFQQLLRASDRQAFIDDYVFDISVTTDDKPFFMEHSRWSGVLEHSDHIFDRANGHLLLLVTTLVVALFAILFILVPARQIRTASSVRTGRLPSLIFFAALGSAYVLVEIVLVQKLTLYLGNPAYALAVVLCALLVFSGIGSALSGRLRGPVRRRLLVVCLAIACVLALYTAALGPLAKATLALPLWGRGVVVLALLAPPATLMGIPFPTAVAALGTERQDLVVGGWVVNGYFSVLGSCLAVVLSISVGFSGVLLFGAAIYVLAALVQPRLAPPVSASDTA